MTRPPATLFSFKCLSPKYLEALKEKTAGSLLRYQTGPKWVTFALAKSGALHPKYWESRSIFTLCMKCAGEGIQWLDTGGSFHQGGGGIYGAKDVTRRG